MQQQPETQELRHSWAGRPDEGGEDEIDLVELMYRLLEKWKIIVLACILGALIAGVYTICFVTPMYTATSKLYVVNAKDSAINLSDLQIGNYLASDYTEVFSNWHVHEMVLERARLYLFAAFQHGFSHQPAGYTYFVCRGTIQRPAGGQGFGGYLCAGSP